MGVDPQPPLLRTRGLFQSRQTEVAGVALVVPRKAVRYQFPVENAAIRQCDLRKRPAVAVSPLLSDRHDAAEHQPSGELARPRPEGL